MYKRQRTHFERPEGLFDIPTTEYVLEAIPTELVTFVVRDDSGEPLEHIQVARAPEGTAAWLGERAEKTHKVIVSDSPSPVLLPYVRAEGPVWFHISSEGFATASLLADPRKSGDYEVRLWPAAELDVRLNGPGRSAVHSVVLAGAVTGSELRHTATFAVQDPSAESGPDGLTFPIRGLSARPHTVTAKALDKYGRMSDVAEVRVELEPGERHTVELFVP